jgi:hypothetical protein
MSTNKTKNTRVGKGRKYSYRRKNKNGTMRKVMRGCNSMQYGGASAPLGMLEVPQPHNGGNTNPINVHLSKSLTSLQMAAGNKPPVIADHPIHNSFTSTADNKMSGGSYKSKHRRVRYKKSIARRGRSRRFRKTKRH